MTPGLSKDIWCHVVLTKEVIHLVMELLIDPEEPNDILNDSDHQDYSHMFTRLVLRSSKICHGVNIIIILNSTVLILFKSCII